MKRCLCIWLALMLLLTGACCEEIVEIEVIGEEVPAQEEIITQPEITQDEENGLWTYKSQNLRITITRYDETVTVKKKEKPLRYFVTEVYASAENPLRTALAEGKVPGKSLDSPLDIAQQANAVLAITDDFCGYRIRNNNKVGICIRNGIVLGTKTRSSSRTRGWPNLDTLALLPDGSMKASLCDAYTAEEYLAMGAQDVFAFGPILISEGKVNEQLYDSSYYPYNEPRMAIGMVEPYHYIILTVVGRNDKVSVGCHLDWLADKMLSLGCTEALNLDGGDTAVLIFMGQVLNRSSKSMRGMSGMICFGYQ